MAVTGVRRPERSTTNKQAYDAILAAIIDGSIPAGTPLRLQELSDALGMSMMPIREAIRQLESIGVIESIPHRGSRVRAISTQDLADTYLTRNLLEGTLVRLAAPRFDEAAAQECRTALDAQQAALLRGDVAEARRAHERFHYRIYEAAGSRWLLRSIAPTWHNSERYRAASTADLDTVRRRKREHERILRACIDHHPDGAYNALRDHLISSVRAFDADVADQLTEVPLSHCTGDDSNATSCKDR